jgi:HD-GYP domain-containing protein (c-di-GMP phosphodiesterase class II)
MFEPDQDQSQGYFIKVDTSDLAVGMYVQELDRPWTKTPFLFQGFCIKSTEEIDTLREHCDYVYVDREQSIDLLPDACRFGIDNSASLANQVKGIARAYRKTGIYADSVPVEQELDVAKNIYAKSHSLVQEMFTILRADGIVSVHEIRETANNIIASVLRNPDAFMLLQIVKNKDSYSYTHAVNCCALAASFCRHLGFTEEEIRDIALGALMLDVGIVKLPSKILEKQGPLNPASLKLVRHHVDFSMDMIKRIPQVPGIVHDMIMTHHERMNGKGYPLGIKGSRIPVCGRIAAIVDCYDAMISKRPYKKSLSPSEAVCEIYKWRKTDFHEELVEQFIQCLGAYPTGTLVELTSGQVGIVMSQNRMHRLYPKILLILDAEKMHYEQPKIIDLWEYAKKSRDMVLDIQRTVEPDRFDIDPTCYYL